MKSTRVKRCGLSSLGAALVLALVSSPVAAQSTATLQGLVTDEQGALMPGASIVVSSQATGVSRTAVTDAAGQYLVASLAPGLYRVEAQLSGFKTLVKEVELAVARTVTLDFQLAVGTLTEAVSVVAETPIIESSTISVGQVINQRTVQEIPLNGRHFVDLGLLIPGSVTPPQTGFLTAPLRGQGSFAFNTAGNREDTVNFMINGVNLNDMVQNQITFQPSINTVSGVQSRQLDLQRRVRAQLGRDREHRHALGQQRLPRRGVRVLPQRRSSTPATSSIPRRRGNRRSSATSSGPALGGPIQKNRTFFFGSYEGLRQRQGIDVNSGVLRDDERAAVTDPVSRNLLPLIPAATTIGARGEGRFVGSATAPVDIDQGTGDINHILGQNDRLHGYYAFQARQAGRANLAAQHDSRLRRHPGVDAVRSSRSTRRTSSARAW